MITRLATLISLLTTAATLQGEEVVHKPCKMLISPTSIHERLQEIAHQIEHDYQGKDLVIVMVMKGALCIVADLIRVLDLPFNVEAVQCCSYGASGKERKELKVFGLDRISVHNRDVLIVDDIFDSGHTIATLVQEIQKHEPRSIKTCVLLKKNVPRETKLIPDYSLFEIENLFVVGYGLDYKEEYRGLPGIYVIE